MPAVVQTCLWFEDRAEEAAEAYVALLPGSKILRRFPLRGVPGRVFMVHVELVGRRYSFLNGGPHYRLSPAASIELHLDTQAEVDRVWDALLEGGEAMRCGWLTDRWGVSRQILPKVLGELMASPDEEAAGRVAQAMAGMVKLDAEVLLAAARG